MVTVNGGIVEPIAPQGPVGMPNGTYIIHQTQNPPLETAEVEIRTEGAGKTGVKLMVILFRCGKRFKVVVLVSGPNMHNTFVSSGVANLERLRKDAEDKAIKDYEKSGLVRGACGEVCTPNSVHVSDDHISWQDTTTGWGGHIEKKKEDKEVKGPLVLGPGLLIAPTVPF